MACTTSWAGRRRASPISCDRVGAGGGWPPSRQCAGSRRELQPWDPILGDSQDWAGYCQGIGHGTWGTKQDRTSKLGLKGGCCPPPLASSPSREGGGRGGAPTLVLQPPAQQAFGGPLQLMATPCPGSGYSARCSETFSTHLLDT